MGAGAGHKLVLVKHSLPEIVPALPAAYWHLSVEGRQRCHALARELVPLDPSAIISSREPKAVETAQIVADQLGRPLEVNEELHEHDRSNVQWQGQEAFEAAVAAFFVRPRDRVFGNETADQAHHRFTAALERAIGSHPAQNIVVVSHGTVITLFVSRQVCLEPFHLWKRLGLPSFVVLSLPELHLLSITGKVEASV
jgi:broad specificity phosphatase PhoE